jgi:hypothetical protein
VRRGNLRRDFTSRLVATLLATDIGNEKADAGKISLPNSNQHVDRDESVRDTIMVKLFSGGSTEEL